MSHDAYRHPLVERLRTILRPAFEDVVRIALHRPDEARYSIVNVEAALAAIGEAVEEASIIGPRGLIFDYRQRLIIAELLLGTFLFFNCSTNVQDNDEGYTHRGDRTVRGDGNIYRPRGKAPGKE